MTRRNGHRGEVGDGRSRRPARPDEDFAARLYAEHGGPVLAYATKLTGDRAAAEDVLQETIIRAWRRPNVFSNGKGSVRAWMFTVAHHLVVDRARARASRPTEVAATDAMEPATADPSDRVVDALTVRRALGELSEEHRGVLVQVYYRGRTVREAADALSIPPGTVKSRCHHALRALRRSFLGELPTGCAAA
jgi:RNA polymerase sigma-70 factor (ECF subfamily)